MAGIPAGCAAFIATYTSTRAGVSVLRLERATLLGYQGGLRRPLELPLETFDVSSDPRLARIRRNVQDGVRPHRTSPQAALSRDGPLSGHPVAGLSPRQGGAQLSPGFRRPRTQGPGQGRYDLPDLFHDQADHLGGVHDAVRG